MQISVAYERRILERWGTIEPLLTVWLKSHACSGTEFKETMADFKIAHREAIIDALDLHIPFRAIRLYGLDDPRISDDEREGKRQKFLALRRRHPGRTPSLGRQNSKRPPAIMPGDI